MHPWLHKTEVIVDRLIPPVLAALVIVILGEIFFSHQFEFYKHYADWFDGFVLLVFAADLGFKYNRSRKLPNFVRKYWLEIIATIPFFMVFRLMEFLKFTDLIEKGQTVAHEALAAEKIEREAAMMIKEARTVEITRTARLINTFRAIGRFPRLLKAASFFEKPKNHHKRAAKKSHVGKRKKFR